MGLKISEMREATSLPVHYKILNIFITKSDIVKYQTMDELAHKKLKYQTNYSLNEVSFFRSEYDPIGRVYRYDYYIGYLKKGVMF